VTDFLCFAMLEKPVRWLRVVFARSKQLFDPAEPNTGGGVSLCDVVSSAQSCGKVRKWAHISVGDSVTCHSTGEEDQHRCGRPSTP
jgi:hypothetical protein